MFTAILDINIILLNCLSYKCLQKLFIVSKKCNSLIKDLHNYDLLCQSNNCQYLFTINYFNYVKPISYFLEGHNDGREYVKLVKEILFSIKYSGNYFIELIKKLKNYKSINYMILHSATNKGNIKLVKFAYTAGIDLDLQILMTETICNGHLNVVKYFHWLGYNYLVTDEYYIKLAKKYNCNKIVKYLSKYKQYHHTRQLTS